MHDYITVTDEILRLIPSLKQDIFDYRDTPIEAELESAFQFYQQAMIDHYKYGTEPSYLFFNSMRTVNAQAGKIAGIYLIGINIGTLSWLKESSTNAANAAASELASIYDQLDNPIEVLIHDFALHFTFYHEQAHLIQKSEFLAHFLQEEPLVTEEYSMERHILEFDADEFSSLCLGGHLLQYSNNIFDQPT